MRRSNLPAKLLFLTILLIGFFAFIFIKYFFLDRANAEGQIKILSSPRTSVFINNVATGKSTPYEAKLKIGEYTIKVIPQEATATASWQGKVRIYKNSLSYINRELGATDVTSAGEVFTVTKMEKRAKGEVGEVYVETDPNGAIVYLDNDEKGVAPLVMTEVPTGTHELSVFLPGFFRRTQKINIDKGNRVSAQFKIAIDQSQKKVDLKPKVATPSAQPNAPKVKIKILDTGTGFLRVRSEPSTSGSEVAQVKPDEEFEVLEEKNSWYKIEYASGQEGWVSGEFVETL